MIWPYDVSNHVDHPQLTGEIRKVPVLSLNAYWGAPRMFISTSFNGASMAKYKCPYCGSEFDTAEELSRHIDRVHHGSGLLEGDTRKY